MSNFPDGDTVFLDMDLEQVVTDGIVIPSFRQTPSGMFKFSFDFLGDSEKKYFYKI